MEESRKCQPPFIKKFRHAAREMAQLVCEVGKGSSDLQKPQKCWVALEAACNPVTWKVEMGEGGSPRASWLGRLTKSDSSGFK